MVVFITTYMFKISAPKFFSLLLSVTPFIFRWLYGSWIVTRQIVPAKGVFWGFMSFATIYMIVEMYMEKNYDSQNALMVNCLTMGMNVVTLFVYFLHGREIKMVDSLGAPLCS